MMIIVLAAGLCSVVFNKLRLPAIIGYLLAGIVIKNIVQKNFEMPESTDVVIEILKDLGLVMLFFCIGTELNVEKLRNNSRFATAVVILQLPLMIFIGVIFGSFFLKLDGIASISLGAIISGSSTAVVASVLKTQEQISSEEADIIILITIMEDIGQIVILSMITPLFLGSEMGIADNVKLVMLIILFMTLVFVLGIRVVPKVLNWVGDNTSEEVLLVFSIGICFLMAYFSISIGMSMATGAFLMGVIVSQCNYVHRIEEMVSPMKEFFMSIFFISVGMEVLVKDFTNSIGFAFVIFLLFACAKFFTVFLGYYLGGKSFENGFVSSISLIAMGEFAFVIAAEALKNNVIDREFYTAIISAALISAIVLPIASKKMFEVIGQIRRNCPKSVVSFGRAIYSARDDFTDKMNEFKGFNEFMTKNLKKSHFCIVFIITIEIVFMLLTNHVTRLFAEYLYRIMTNFSIDQTLVISCTIYIAVNFLLLLPPLTILIETYRRMISVIIYIDDKGLDKYDTLHPFYKKFVSYSPMALAVLVDLIIMNIVPGPFSFSRIMIASFVGVIIFVISLICLKIKDYFLNYGWVRRYFEKTRENQ
ncbi:MAG: cation:proton antiporter [archaeon]|nr:cation:proton antiporter [archaeon]